MSLFRVASSPFARGMFNSKNKSQENQLRFIELAVFMSLLSCLEQWTPDVIVGLTTEFECRFQLKARRLRA